MPMQVKKRDGRMQDVSFDKILRRIGSCAKDGGLEHLDVADIAKQVIAGLRDGITTVELDHLAAETAAYSTTKDAGYGRLAARIAIDNLHKETTDDFAALTRELHEYVQPRTGQVTPLVSDAYAAFVSANQEALAAAIDYERDFAFDYFGFKTLERSYLMRFGDRVVERPQHLYMRVACGIHPDDLDAALRTYDLLSQHFFTHATPTMYNAGAVRAQMSSCFLLTMTEDSIDGIYDTLKRCAQISKHAGGIGLSIHNVRATGSYIAGTNGSSSGIVPMLRVFNDTARYVDQAGRRKGAIAAYLEPWHADVFQFLDLKKNHGKEEMRARDLFYAMWIPDLFMKRARADEPWSLFCPNEAPGLADVHGAEFEALYAKYEAEGRARQSIPARRVLKAIVDSQIETGTPYMLYKDACNAKSNQQHLGTIKSSNLCTEIIEYTAPDEVAVCNLASIALPRFVTDGGFDYDKLRDVTATVTRNLDKVIDANYYPVPEASASNMRHRPVGIGVQGLADALALLGVPYESEKARIVNKAIFEHMYYAAVETSAALAAEKGAYPTFEGSPAAAGRLQPDLWGLKDEDYVTRDVLDWPALRSAAAKGLRNSLLLAPMPTASTAQIMGNNEGTEPFTSNMYNRRVLSGEFAVVNKHLMAALQEAGVWGEAMRQALMARGGSVQGLRGVPARVQELYKTVWEIKQKAVIDMAADRGPFICQSQSLNIHMAEPSQAKLTSMHFYAWSRGLKTGMYYLRTKPKAQTIQFTVDASVAASVAEKSGSGGGSESEGGKTGPATKNQKKGSGSEGGGEEVCRRRVGDDGAECFVCGS